MSKHLHRNPLVTFASSELPIDFYFFIFDRFSFSAGLESRRVNIRKSGNDKDTSEPRSALTIQIGNAPSNLNRPNGKGDFP